jgi:hypothetical protein
MLYWPSPTGGLPSASIVANKSRTFAPRMESGVQSVPLPNEDFGRSDATFQNALSNSRRQLTTVFDKPAFSRVSQNCEPLIVVVLVRARNPRFLMPLFGQKTGFRARMNEIKSGIQCSGFSCMSPCFCETHLANMLQNRKHCIERATLRCNVLNACGFCKTHLANMLQKNKASNVVGTRKYWSPSDYWYYSNYLWFRMRGFTL